MGTLPLVTILLRQPLPSRVALAAENLALPEKVAVLGCSVKHTRFHRRDRIFWVRLSRLCRASGSSLLVAPPETVLRWHRQGLRLPWRWKSRPRRPGRPRISREIRELIRPMYEANPTWGATRIDGELLKLDLTVAEFTVSKYLPGGRKPPSQSWRTFLRNPLRDAVAVDFAVVPTVRSQLLFLIVALSLEQRKLLHLNVTTCPTAEWTAKQLVEAFPWDCPRNYLTCDRKAVYGEAFRRRVAAVGLREVILAPRAPWPTHPGTGTRTGRGDPRGWRPAPSI